MKTEKKLAFHERIKRLISKPWLIPDILLVYVLNKISTNMRMDTGSFGWLQAIFYSWRIDQLNRYISIVRQIKMLNEQPMSILDVGGAVVISRNS